MIVRRLVTRRDERGKSVVAHDGEPPWSKQFEHTPGFASSFIWSTTADVTTDSHDPTNTASSIVPGPGRHFVADRHLPA